MLGPFACARYRFVLRARTPLWLNAFAGATLRGGFGHIFKRTVCLWPPGDCARCLLRTACAYPYVFETAPPPGSEKLRGLSQIPRPFVLERGVTGERSYRPGETFDFRLVLVGRAIDYLPYFVFTFRELGQAGLGADLGQFELAEVHAEGPDDSECVYTAAEGVLRGTGPRITEAELAARYASAVEVGGRLTVQFVTPTRIRNDGALRTDVTFQDLVRALLRRLSSLCYFHCGCELQADFKGLIEQTSTIRTVSSNLRWENQQRISGRQRQRIDMGGVVGSVTYEAAGWAPYLSLLAAGEWVHVGKGAVMGLGKYTLEGG